MSLPGSAQDLLQIDLRPSRLLQRAVIVSHGVTVLCLSVLPWPWWLSLPAAVAAAGFGCWHVCHLRSKVVTRLTCDEQGRWTLQMADGVHGAYHLLPDTFVHPRLTILNFGGAGRRSVVLLPDSLDAASFRRLRVWLRTCAATCPAGRQRPVRAGSGPSERADDCRRGAGDRD